MPEQMPMRPIAPDELDRFHDLAPSTLVNRDRQYFMREFETGLNYIIGGLIPIVGILLWGWSASHWLLFLVAGCWVGLLSDCIRLHFLKKQIDAYCERIVDDAFVSVIGEAVRAGKNEISGYHVPKKPSYGIGVFLDLVFCSISSLVILVSLPTDAGVKLFEAPGFLLTFSIFFGYRVISMIGEIVALRISSEKKPTVKLALGLRAASMFVLMFIVLMVFDEPTESASGYNWVVYIVNGLLIGLGLLQFFGGFLMMSETRWLRGYIEGRERQLAS